MLRKMQSCPAALVCQWTIAAAVRRKLSDELGHSGVATRVQHSYTKPDLTRGEVFASAFAYCDICFAERPCENAPILAN
jgi:hypothetical protein